MDTLPDTAGHSAEACEPEGPTQLETEAKIRMGLLGYLALLATAYTFYFAREIFIPLFLALLLKMLLAPLMRLFTRIHVPVPIAALMVVALLVGAVGGIGYGIQSPAQRWFQQLPREMPKLRTRLHNVLDPLHQMQQATRQVEQATQPDAPRAVVVKQPGWSEDLFSGTRSLLTAIATTLLLLFALLATGDHFLRRIVEAMPGFKEKRHAVQVVHLVQHDISIYLVTITLVNITMGCVAGAICALVGLPDPQLWGVMAGVLNYIPYLGPLMTVSILSFIGLLTFPDVGDALLAPAIYAGATLVEGNFLTPLLLSYRLQINAVCVFVGLMVFAFIWGIPGMLLAVPLLAMTRIVCDHVPTLWPIGRLLGDGKPTLEMVHQHAAEHGNGAAK
jgi:predicted PurR-regulated permease PerM